MLADIRSLLAQNKIDICSALPLSCCRILRPYLLKRTDITSGTVFVFAVPYLSQKALVPERNISAYAAPRDYHGFFNTLFDNILPVLQRLYPNNKFVGFSDHSPIDERHAAASAGLGILGDNGMLITERYSSYVFLGEIITDAEIECTTQEIKHCESCGACQRACPYGMSHEDCLSALTQKKGGLTCDEEELILKYKSAWGCDICQEICPYTQKALKANTITSNIPYFNDNVIPCLAPDILTSMYDADFSLRAYSWRGRETIMRNLVLLHEKESAEENEKGRKYQ